MTVNIPQTIKKEFKEITGLVLCERQTNFLSDKEERKDNLFEDLTRIVFDDPKIIIRLEKAIAKWLIAEAQSETVMSMAGYVNYFKEDYKKARDYFLQAVSLNPDNFDNWHDLAFALRHLGEINASKIILYFHEYVIYYFKFLNLAGKKYSIFKAAILEIGEKAIKSKRSLIK